MDNISLEPAIAQLEISLEVAENNAPINESEGNTLQADLERHNADSYRAALHVLRVFNELKVVRTV